MTPVTMLTRDASLDDLSIADYWDIYDELRPWVAFPDGPDKNGKTGKREPSIDIFRALIKTEYSKALWEKYREWMETPPTDRQGPCPLNRAMRSELRVAMGLQPLPPTVAEATSQASPDAAVWTVGEGVPDTVVMVALSEPVTLRVNGSVEVVTESPALPPNSSVAPRKRYWRTCLSFAQKERTAALNACMPTGEQYTTQEVYEIGLRALEVMA